MGELEIRFLSPEEMGRQLETQLRRQRENKYALQVKLSDVDFDVNDEVATRLGTPPPFKGIEDAETALRNGVIVPNILFEIDGTEHTVTAFDPTPVGYSGFMNCVTHSLALTNHGLFEVGRFAAVRMSSAKEWQWFIHRRLATGEEIAAWKEIYKFAPHQLLEVLIESFTLPHTPGTDTPPP
jgi:hypothetical protein